MARLADVARKAGASVSTASVVLNPRPNVPVVHAERAARVREVARMSVLFCPSRLRKTYAHVGWILVEDRRLIKRDRQGRIVELGGDDIAMYLPLARTELPDGPIGILRTDW